MQYLRPLLFGSLALWITSMLASSAVAHESLFVFLRQANSQLLIAVIAKSGHASPVEVSIKELPMLCQRAISANAPDAASDLLGPEVDKDWNGDLSVHWSSSSYEFFRHPSGEKRAAKAIASACPKIVMVVYSGPMGATERWYIRRDGFSVRHSRDSGMPGDEDKYWGWDTIPFNYDPHKDYK